MRRPRKAASDDHPKIERMTFRPVTPARRGDLEALFESPRRSEILLVHGVARGGGPEKPNKNPDKVWSLVCFFVKREFRGKSVMTQLLYAAVAYAKKKSATVAEGYPAAKTSPSYRFMGFVPSFESRQLQARRPRRIAASCDAQSALINSADAP